MPTLGNGVRSFVGVPGLAAEVPVVVLHTEDPTELFKTIKRRGFNPVWLSELSDARLGQGSLPPNPVCVTFDDGDPLWYSRNLALHQSYNIKASLCVTSDYLYGTATAAFPSPGITWTQARTMHATGLFDWQNHTKTHVTQTSLSDAAFDTELSTCHSAIVNELGARPPVALIWPYGNYDFAKVARVKAAGYTMALTLGCLHPDQHPGSGTLLERVSGITDLLRWARQPVLWDFENDASTGVNTANGMGYWTTAGTTTISTDGRLSLSGASASFVSKDYFHVSCRSLYARVRGITTGQSAGTAKISVLQYDKDQGALSTIDLFSTTANTDTTFDNIVPLDANCAFVRIQATTDASFNGTLQVVSGILHAKI